jgi:hypothetical protein
VAERATDYSTFSIFGLEKTKKKKNIFQRMVGAQFEIRKWKVLDYNEAMNVTKLELCSAQ